MHRLVPPAGNPGSAPEERFWSDHPKEVNRWLNIRTLKPLFFLREQ